MTPAHAHAHEDCCGHDHGHSHGSGEFDLRAELTPIAIAGESMPRSVAAGKTVLSGMINQSGLLTVKVTKAFNESSISRILELVENASSKKAETRKFITRFAQYYTQD